MRGRISAVNSVFVGSSNELGGFESGLAAAIFGPILAVVGGGVGTLLVVIAVGLIWPEVRQLGRLVATEVQPVADAIPALPDSSTSPVATRRLSS
jgi:hypothetical protein